VQPYRWISAVVNWYGVTDERRATVPEVKKIARKGTQLLVDPDTLDRGRALAVVRKVSVATVWRDSIVLDGQEQAHQAELDALAALFKKYDLDPSATLEWMIKKNINADALEGVQKALAEVRA
jgi:hypothetical protein